MKQENGLEYILILAVVLLFSFCCLQRSRPQLAAMMSSQTELQPETGLQEIKQIALTFDDGPHPYYTELLLDGLKERNVQATFFLIGESIEGKEDIVKRMSEEGHIIGNHTYSHVQVDVLSDDAACAEIWKTNTAIFDITGKIPVYIRPPYGLWDDTLACAVEMQPVLWNIDPEDWKYQNKERIVKSVVKHAKDGGIILLHDIYKTSVVAALEIVDVLENQGYEFITVDELLLD